MKGLSQKPEGLSSDPLGHVKDREVALRSGTTMLGGALVDPWSYYLTYLLALGSERDPASKDEVGHSLVSRAFLSSTPVAETDGSP